VAPLAESAATSIRRARPDGAEAEEILEQVESSIALFEGVVLHAWRRRLLRVLASGERSERGDEAVGFADLAGFTALVRRNDDGWLDALDTLEAVAFDVVASHGGRVVKTIGDEVMWVHPDPEGMVATCTVLATAAAAHPSLPPLRIGAAWGETVATRGDRFGMPVNLASRLVRRCPPREVLLCPVLTGHAPGAVRGVPRRIKGIGWIRPGRLRPITRG
jgi:adenylate cyclase